MDQSEAKAHEFLTAQGFADIVPEPDGNVPPDLAINNTVAVEVRRLNQNYEVNGRTKGLEEDAQPLWHSLQKVVRRLGPDNPNENWCVSFSFRRPYGSRRTITRQARSVLSDFIVSSDRHPTTWQLTPGFRLEVIRAGNRLPTLFTMAGYTDHNDGGWLLSEMQRNLMICIAEKSKKRANAKRSYAEWWLVLLDHIGYGLPDREDRDQLRTLVPRAGEWDKIILLNPLDLACSFVLQDKATVLANRLTEARLNSAPRSAR